MLSPSARQHSRSVSFLGNDVSPTALEVLLFPMSFRAEEMKVKSNSFKVNSFTSMAGAVWSMEDHPGDARHCMSRLGDLERLYECPTKGLSGTRGAWRDEAGARVRAQETRATRTLLMSVDATSSRHTQGRTPLSGFMMRASSKRPHRNRRVHAATVALGTVHPDVVWQCHTKHDSICRSLQDHLSIQLAASADTVVLLGN